MWKKSSDMYSKAFLSTTVFQVRGDADFLWTIAAGPGAEEWQSPQNPALLSESHQDIRYLFLCSKQMDFLFSMTLPKRDCALCRNHALQRLLSGQHRNDSIWSQRPWWERKTVIHRLCRTHVRMTKFDLPLVSVMKVVMFLFNSENKTGK